ncbi:MAG: Gfo/Idh/MocA family oxidoreductase [Kangiellaceae bacterium]
MPQALKQKKIIRWGIIGCGQVTEVKSGPAFQQTNGFELAAVTRRNTQLANDYAVRHNIKTVFDSADELINSQSIDAVYIATPPDSHKQYAVKVANAGKPCCVEKPMSSCYADSLAIYQAFQKSKVPLFVAYYRRSLPRFQKVKSLLESGEIGQVRHISWTYVRPPSELDLSGMPNWRTDKNIARGGYFDDLASHGLDLFGYFFGEFEMVKGIVTNQQQLYSSYDSISANWKHKNNVTGQGSWNFGGYSRVDEVVIYGEKGELHFSIFAEQPIRVVNQTGSQSYHIENPTHIQKYHVEAIKRQLFFSEPHPSTGKSGLQTCWVMQQILGN